MRMRGCYVYGDRGANTFLYRTASTKKSGSTMRIVEPDHDRPRAARTTGARTNLSDQLVFWRPLDNRRILAATPHLTRPYPVSHSTYVRRSVTVPWVRGRFAAG